MLTLKLLREQPQFVIERLAVKNFDAKAIVEKILKTDEQRRAVQAQLDANFAEQNKAAKSIGMLMKEGNREAAEAAKQEVAQLKIKSAELSQQLEQLSQSQLDDLVLLPNLPYQNVPVGKSAEENLVVKEGGEKKSLPENALPHWELAKNLGIIDFDLGVKLTGAGFPVYIGKGAKIQRALISYFLDRNTKAGYVEVQPPLVVNEASAFATGQLPDKGEQMYYIGLDNFYLIPTAEVPVTNLYRDMILQKRDFPIKLTAYTQCFRDRKSTRLNSSH